MKRERPAYSDPELSVDARVCDLLGRMTLDEKIRQMGTLNGRDMLRGTGIDLKAATRALGTVGIGALLDPRLGTDGNAKAINALQSYLTKRTRLGIPAFVVSECLHGYFAPGATIFPIPPAMAASWRPELIQKVAAAAAKEARLQGVNQVLSPVLDLGRDPRWGRTDETFGECPYLASRCGVAYVKDYREDSQLWERKT